jgi:hypothetical protein
MVGPRGRPCCVTRAGHLPALWPSVVAVVRSMTRTAWKYLPETSGRTGLAAPPPKAPFRMWLPPHERCFACSRRKLVIHPAILDANRTDSLRAPPSNPSYIRHMQLLPNLGGNRASRVPIRSRAPPAARSCLVVIMRLVSEEVNESFTDSDTASPVRLEPIF